MEICDHGDLEDLVDSNPDTSFVLGGYKSLPYTFAWNVFLEFPRITCHLTCGYASLEEVPNTEGERAGWKVRLHRDIQFMNTEVDKKSIIGKRFDIQWYGRGKPKKRAQFRWSQT